MSVLSAISDGTMSGGITRVRQFHNLVHHGLQQGASAEQVYCSYMLSHPVDQIHSIFVESRQIWIPGIGRKPWR